METRVCKKCHAAKPYAGEMRRGTKARGFIGRVCYECVAEEQRAWRGEEAGREYARAASRKSHRKSVMADVNTAVKDAVSWPKEATSRRIL